MLSRRILTVIGLFLAISAYMVFFKDDQRFMLPLVICILLGAIAYIFHFQIDFWWVKRQKPKLSAPMRAMLYQSNQFIHTIGPEDQEKFEQRMELWVAAKEYISKGIEDLPEDLKYITAIYPIMLTIFKEKFLFEDLDRIAFYPHAFLSPGYPDDIHCCEVEKEDGVFIFSIEQMMVGHMQPKRYYNILLHSFAEAYKFKFPEEQYPVLPDHIWNLLGRMSQISKEKVDHFIGIKQEDPWPMAVHHFFVYPKRFMELAPELYKEFVNWHQNVPKLEKQLI
jgi:Mlc titration factor MtfA (ptsG expression regulator)